MDNCFFYARINDLASLKENLTDVNIKDDDGNSLLFHAIKNNAYDVVLYLFEKKANIELENNKGETPLFIASKLGKENIIKALIKKGCHINRLNIYNENALCYALLKGSLGIVKLLIESGISTNIDTNEGLKLEHYAVRSGNFDIIEYLYKKNLFKTNVVDIRGNTLLHYASKTNNIKIAKFLIKNNLYPYYKNNDMETALYDAVRYGSNDMIKFIIDNSIGIDFVNRFDETIFDVTKNNKVIGYIKNIEASSNYQNKIKKYALHKAILENDYKKIIELKDNRLYYIKDQFGLEPIDIAKLLNNEEIIELIK